MTEYYDKEVAKNSDGFPIQNVETILKGTNSTTFYHKKDDENF